MPNRVAAWIQSSQGRSMCDASPVRFAVRRICLLLLTTLAWGATVDAAAQTNEGLSQADLLRRLIDLDRLSTPRTEEEQAGIFSSSKRGSKDKDGWEAWATIQGPGVVTRFWCEKLTGELRITIDDQPVVRGKVADFFRGAIEPFGEPLTYSISADAGGMSYYPIGFSKACKIEVRGCDGGYQIDYAALPQGTQVEPFAGKMSEATEKTLANVASTLKNGFTEKQLLAGRKSIPWANQGELKPKSEPLRLTIDRDCTMRAFYVALTDKVEPRELYALHNLVLRIWSSGSKGPPDVEAPLVDFFGSSFDRRLYASLVMGTNRVTDMPGEFPQEGFFLYCFYPMPMWKGARVEIENCNQNKKGIGILMHALTDRDPPKQDALVFRARYLSEDPCKSAAHLLSVDPADRSGRLVGVTLGVDCPRADWWGAGGVRFEGAGQPAGIAADGFAAFLGNIPGLKPVKHALSGVTLQAPFGKNAVYRWMISDDLPFRDSLTTSFENRQVGGAKDVSFFSICYWYGLRDAKLASKPIKTEMLKLPGVRFPHSVEIEGNLEGKEWGTLLKERDANVELSGGAAASIRIPDPPPAGLVVKPVVAKVVVQKAGKYKLRVRAVPERSFDPFEVLDANDKLIGAVKWARTPDNLYDVGEVELRAGENVLKIKVSKKAVLDCWILEPL